MRGNIFRFYHNSCINIKHNEFPYQYFIDQFLIRFQFKNAYYCDYNEEQRSGYVNFHLFSIFTMQMRRYHFVRPYSTIDIFNFIFLERKQIDRFCFN